MNDATRAQLRRRFKAALIGLAALAAGGFVDASYALTIDVRCSGALVGTVTVDIVAETATDRGGVEGGFTSNAALYPTLGDAAAKCGEDHFNWYQLVWSTNGQPVDASGNPLTAPFLDPPPGGYGNAPGTPGDDTQWADNLPYYFDEGPDPPAGTPSFVDGFNLADNIVGNTLQFFDFPNGPEGKSDVFKTFLASVNADGTLHALYAEFAWQWSRPAGTLGGASNLRLPEPGGLPLLVLAVVLAFGARHRRRTR